MMRSITTAALTALLAGLGAAVLSAAGAGMTPARFRADFRARLMAADAAHGGKPARRELAALWTMIARGAVRGFGE
jgi:hypothetical protein